MQNINVVSEPILIVDSYTHKLVLTQKYYGKKTTYALETPHVVALPFIYGVESLLALTMRGAREATSLVFMPSYTLLGI